MVMLCGFMLGFAVIGRSSGCSRKGLKDADVEELMSGTLQMMVLFYAEECHVEWKPDVIAISRSHLKVPVSNM